ncbi:MAG TPA: hypothetical protein VMS31_12580, partial [Pyrinomonadaceae bacterium]|nr:hypothetical protein [Pyrinomonadaceae bacterium]
CVSAVLLLLRNNAWRDPKFWLRAGATMCLASLLLLPFVLPLRRVAAEHGFTRSPGEVRQYSARMIHWLAADDRNKVWRGLGSAGNTTEMVLFPGLLAPLLALGAFLLSPRRSRGEDSHSEESKEPVPKDPAGYLRMLLILLDATAIICGVVALLTLGYDTFKWRLFGQVVLSASSPSGPLGLLGLTVFVRCLIAYPRVLRQALGGDKNLLASFNSNERSELFGHSLVWIVIGFAGSFGLNFFFHKFLYDYVPLFRGMRVATRWGMICYVGLALLAGLGASRLAGSIGRQWPRFGKPAVYAVVVLLVLFELHATPLTMVRGEIHPDTLTLDLKSRRMSGGILELPMGDVTDHLYMLRAADHLHPLVNGKYSYVPPLQLKLEGLSRARPIPDELLDMIEKIPVSYLTVHQALMSTEEQVAFKMFLDRGLAAGRLRFVKSFDDEDVNGIKQHNDLYAVTKTEPQ